MSLHSLFENQFNDVVGQEHGSGTLLLPTEDGDLQCIVSEANPIACRLERLSYFSERVGTATGASLEQLGRELSRRVSYLMEPLALTEIDGEAACVQLRSSPPQSEAGTVRYYELTISRDRGLHLQRYQAPRGQSREGIAANITREMLERLAGDCIQSTKEILS